MKQDTATPQTPGHPDAAPSVNLTRKPATRAQTDDHGTAARREAQLPHERDQQPDSQAGPQAPHHEVGEQAFRDVSHGLVDTDESLRKSAVDRRDAQHASPTSPVISPREATLSPDTTLRKPG